jgi:hypothetical protein
VIYELLEFGGGGTSVAREQERLAANRGGQERGSCIGQLVRGCHTQQLDGATRAALMELDPGTDDRERTATAGGFRALLRNAEPHAGPPYTRRDA